MAERVVVAGAGHAAGQLVARLRAEEFAGEIVLVGDEATLPYQRPPLSKAYMAGCLLYTSPSPRDKRQSRMPSSA